jgi:hypothetical protein
MNGLLEDDEKRYANVIAKKQEQTLAANPQSQLEREEQQYQSIIKQKVDQEDELLRQSLMLSVDKNPDQMAQIQKLAADSKMPVELVQRNIARFVKDKRVDDLKEQARLSPVLARQLSDPDFAALAYDDTERLSGLESIVTKPFDYTRAAAEAVVGPTLGMGLSGTGELYGVATRKLEGVLDQILPNSAMSFLRTPIPWYASPEDILKQGGGSLKAIGDVIGPPQERRTFDVEVVGAIAQLGSQIALTLVNPTLSTASLVGQGADIMAEAVDEDDATQAQKDAAIVSGAAITALTERIGIDLILDKLPPKIRNRTLRYIANAAMGGGIEAAQEVTEGLMHDLARRLLTDADAPILEGAIEEASVASVAGAIVRAALTKRSYQRAAQQEEFFRALGDDAKASKLRERMPDKFQQYVENLTKGGPVKEVYIPVDQFNTYFQSKNENPEQKAAQFGATNYMEASAAGTDLVIPLNDFTTKLAPTDDLQGLFQDLRMTPDGQTAREFERYKAEEEQTIADIMEAARRETGEITGDTLLAIREEIRQQLIETGYEQTTADSYATVYTRAMSTLAERAGVDPKTLHDQYNLTVTRPLPDVLTRDRRTDAQIDPLLDRLRAGDTPADREVYGKSLVDFLVESGGLRPVGELVDVDRGRGAFQRNLVQETGMDADTAAARAVEAGYLQGRDIESVTERDLFDAIDMELAGDPQYSMQQMDEQLQGLRDQLDNLARFLEEINVDVSQITDNAEVRRLIRAATESPELQGAVDQLFQTGQERQPGENLLAIHNLTEENVKFAANMGGLASPSVGVVTDTTGMVDQFGEITLIGTKDLADPSAEPVFSSDAYTVRYPRPEWRKPRRADADALYDISAQAERIIATGITQQTDSLTTRYPDAGELITTWLNSDTIRALYLQQQLGQEVELVRDPVRSETNLTPEQLQSLRPLYDVVKEQENQGIRESEELNQLREQLESMMRTYYEALDIRPQVIDSIVERYATNPTFTLGREYDKIRRGPQVNRGETRQRIEEQIDPVIEDFRQWVESTILERFDDPYLTVGRKKVPYTLDNILKVVTSKKEQRAVEETAVYGDAKAKSAAAIKFTDVEQMRQAAQESIVQPVDFEAARQETKETLENYRKIMDGYPHEVTDTLVKFDDAMKAIATFSTSKDKTPEAMRKALAEQGYLSVDQIADSDIAYAISAAEQLLRTPVPYFEAKPQRIVRFDEFAGAVVPLDTSDDVLKILEDNDIRVEFYEGFDRQEVVQRLAGQLAQDQENVLFQGQESAEPFPIEQTVQFEEFATGQPVTFDFVHNTESATAMFGMPEAGDRFQRDLEPSGRYMTRVADASRVDASGNLISGEITFNNPLVLDSTTWKQDLADFYSATGSQLSQKLIAAGYDGVVTINPATETRPAFTSEILDLTTFKPERALYQEKKGFIQFGEERKFNITLLENSDLSTFLHETGHFYLEVLGDLAQGPAANPQLQQDYDAVLKFLGLTSRDELTLDGKDKSSAAYKKAVDAHEKFARAHEAYLMEGKAPNVELRQLFQRFKYWLKQVYKDFIELDVKLSDEVRGVFDRIYATDQEIESAKSEMSFDALLLDADTAGMSEAEFETYRESVRQATESGKEALLAKIMREKQRERKDWWKSELANVKEEVGKEYDELPAAKVFKILTETDTKLSKAELVDLYGAEYLKRVPRGFQRAYTRGEGVPIDVVAKENGFPTGDSLIEALIGLPNRKEYVNAEAERRMIERHGDMMTDGSMADEAQIDLHNGQREKVLMMELRALRRKSSEVRPFVQAERRQQRQERTEMRQAMRDIPPASAFRQAAQGMIGQTAVRDIQPNRFLRAGRKHGKAAEQALINGDAALAADAKQKELLNHFLYLEAVKAQEQSEKIAQYVRKFEKKPARERIGKAGASYLEQIDAVLDGYEFRRIPNRRIDRRAVLQSYVDKREAAARNEEEFSADPIYIPQSVLDDARQINYRQLAYDELLAVNETVRNIDNAARMKNKFLKIAEKRELDEVVGEAFEQIRSNTKGGLSKTLESALAGERLKRFGKGFMLIHRKFASMVEQMDGWKEDGFFWRLLIKPLNDAATFEAVEREKTSKRLSEIFKPYRGTSMAEKKFIPSLGNSMTLEGRLTVALNWGRAENRQRLMSGNGFTDQNINEIFSTLESRDWEFVKNIWSLLDSYFPMVEEQYTKLYGVPPQKSESLPFQTKDGDMPGGYFPISYDPTKSARAMAQSDTDILEQMKSGSYVRSMTNNGYTKEVLENLDRPVKLDFSTIYQHLDTVVHDLALREYLIDVNKLLNHRFDRTTLKDVIIDSYGDQFYREIVQTLKDVTIGDIGAQTAFDQSLGHVRSGVAIMGMGWSLWTGMMQPIGLTQSIVRIGPRWVAKGIAKWGGDIFKMQNTAKMIYDKSPFMRTRYLTQNREINDIRNQIKRQGKYPLARETYGMVEDSYFQLIIQFQKLVDIPTWVGAYEKGLAFGKDEETSIALADQAVIDSQSGGATKDLARIQRGSPLLKIWTVFYSYFNTTFQLMRGSIGRTQFNDPISIGRLAVDVFFLLLAPAAITTVMREAVNLIQGGEPSEEDELIDAYIREQIGYILGTVVGVREFASAIDPRFSYSGPAGVRIVAETQRLATQISQGELDSALRKSAVSVGGILLHYPAAQVNRVIDGMLALEDGRTDKPGALIFGAPR